MGAWFHNPEEPLYAAINVPSRILLTFGGDGERSRMVSWRYDSVPATGWVELICGYDTMRVEAVAQQAVSLGGKSVYYQAKLENLTWNATYQYRLCHPSITSDFFCFSMPDSTSENFSFIYMGDVQDTINGIFPVAMQNIRRKNPDASFYLFGGDVIERPHDCYWGEFFRSMDSVSQATPIVAIPGNHDYIKGVIARLEKRFTLVFPYLNNSDAGENNHVFTFRYKNAQFFLLDSNNGLINLYRQKQWLRRELAKSAARWKIVALHHPLYSIRGKYNNLFVRTFFEPVFNEYGVHLVLQGHEHGYARMTGEGNSPVYIISHNSPKVYKHVLNGNIEKYASAGRYYQHVSVGTDTLELRTFDLQDSIIDSIDSVIKK